jgi:tryptophan 7-dimethylallyltransferase
LTQIHNASFFHVGADCTHNEGIVGKAYFLPHIRSQATGISIDKLVTECMKTLGLEDPWAMVVRYLAVLPQHYQAKIEVVAVDCVQPSDNRVKVYVRTQASSLRSIIDLMTLGGELSDPSILSAIATIRHLWLLFFSEADESVSIPSLRPGHFGSGFSVYFEMRLNRSTPSTKAYIPIRHYCSDDAVIAQAMAQFYREIGLSSVGDRYVSDIQHFWCVFLPLVSVCSDSDAKFFSPHRDLSARTGVQTYIGCAARKGGSQVSVYLSPESYAPERKLKTISDKIKNTANTS